MSALLLPCPHCGETEHLYPAYRLDKDRKCVEPPYAIDCLGCGADFTPRDGIDARAAWNRRASVATKCPECDGSGLMHGYDCDCRACNGSGVASTLTSAFNVDGEAKEVLALREALERATALLNAAGKAIAEHGWDMDFTDVDGIETDHIGFSIDCENAVERARAALGRQP